MNQGKDIVRQLVDDLSPVKPLQKPWIRAISWLSAGVLLVFTFMHLWQPFRDGVIDSLANSPLYLLEVLTGIALAFVCAHSAFVLAVPGASEKRFVSILVALLWLGMVSILVLNFVHSPLEPSMAGKRHLCWVEGLLYGVVILFGMLLALRRSGFFERRQAGLFAGMSAGLIPFVGMQMSCMYIPLHTVTHHLLPAIATSLLGFFASKWFLPKA